MPKPSKLRVARFAAGLTTRDLAALVGVTHTSIEHWETGRNKPSQANLRKLRAILRKTRLPLGNICR